MSLFKSKEEKIEELKKLGFFEEEIEQNEILYADYDNILTKLDQLVQIKNKANKKIEESKNVIDYFKQELKKQKGIRRFLFGKEAKKRRNMIKHIKRLKKNIKNEEHKIKVADTRIATEDLKMNKKEKEIKKSNKFLLSEWRKMKEERYFAHFVLENVEKLQNMYDKKVYDSIIFLFEEIKRNGKIPYNLNISLKSLVKEIKNAIKDYNKRSNTEKEGTSYFLDEKQQLIDFMEKTTQIKQEKPKESKKAETRESKQEEIKQDNTKKNKEKSYLEKAFKAKLNEKIYTKYNINADVFKKLMTKAEKKLGIDDKQFLMVLGVLSSSKISEADAKQEIMDTIKAVRSDDEKLMEYKGTFIDDGAKAFYNIIRQLENNEKNINCNNLGEYLAYNTGMAAQYMYLIYEAEKENKNNNDQVKSNQSDPARSA